MSREIKFRAWDKKAKQWAHRDRVGVSLNGKIIDAFGKSLMDEVFEDHLIEWNKNLVVMQYTGLKDNENAEIYEGDILEYTYYAKAPRSIPRKANGERKIVEVQRRVVEYVANSQFCGFNISTRSANNRRIIGNVHENPELLKKD